MKQQGEEFNLDKRLARLAFERAAATYDGAAVLQRQVNENMLARLEYVKIEPKLILDAGSGTGYGARKLKSRYRQARIVEFDLAQAMLARSRSSTPWWQRRLVTHAAVCGDLERLPFKAGRFDMVWSNLAMQWVNDLDHVFGSLQRVLRPAGLFMFSTFGPDTLKELRATFSKKDGYTHVHRFIDMHDIGDALMRTGFDAPVMDVEYYTLTYDTLTALMKDLKAIGAHNVASGRRRGLAGKTAWLELQSEYQRFAQNHKLPATFEVVYGHAWVRDHQPVLHDQKESVIKVYPKIEKP